MYPFNFSYLSSIHFVIRTRENMSFMKVRRVIIIFLLIFFILPNLSLNMINGDQTYLPTTEIEPEYYTLGFNVGEEQQYFINKAYRILLNGSIRNDINFEVAQCILHENQTVLIRITSISTESFSYDAFLKNSGEDDWYFKRSYTSFRIFYLYPNSFITTTNLSILETQLYKFPNTEYAVVGSNLIYTRYFSTFNLTYVYDLKSGWLIGNFFRMWNATQIISESNLTIRNYHAYWSQSTSSSIFLSISWLIFVFPVVFFYRKHQK